MQPLISILAISSTRASPFNGLIVFGIVAVFGLGILIRGIRGDIVDPSGIQNGSRWWWIIGGLLAQAPLIAFCIFLYRQGYFR